MTSVERQELRKRRALLELGQRAVDYYVDTGLCVFCDADDVEGVPHEGCEVGAVSGVVVDEARVEEKREQRAIVDAFFGAPANR